MFWTLSSGWIEPQASLDGQPLTRGEHGELRPGALLPNHDYTLRLTYSPRVPDAGPSGPIDISFRTGAGSEDAPPKLSISSHTSAPGLGPHPEIVGAQDCFDMGQDTLITLHPERPAELGYVIDGVVWPARFEDPSRYVQALRSNGKCIDVQPIGPGGLLGDATSYCAGGDATKDVARTDEGCRTTRGDGGWLALTAMALVARRRRRSER
ncbi:MAG TPA: MYXO-CTERM sorting domain-containing protein [Polyangiales bacterium]